jgi:hypothetical protein
MLVACVLTIFFQISRLSFVLAVKFADEDNLLSTMLFRISNTNAKPFLLSLF